MPAIPAPSAPRRPSARPLLAWAILVTMEEKLHEVKSGKARDPFAWMDGLADTEETDLASRVDEILYGDAGVH